MRVKVDEKEIEIESVKERETEVERRKCVKEREKKVC